MISLPARESSFGYELPWQQVRLRKGLVVYHQGDLASHWYEVISGIVRTCRFLADGHRQLTGFFYSSDVFGVGGSAYLETAEAVTDIVFRRYPTRILEGDDAARNGVREKLFEKALESARQSIFLFGHRTAASRIAAFLITVAGRSGVSAEVQLSMSRSDIADHLSLTLHTVSRTICDFARRGLIGLDGPQCVRILDLERLMGIAGDGGDAFDPDPDDGFHLLNGAEPCRST